ncbi:CHAT domain-containing protein [Natronoglycomyces albus]|uniref:CHAT domain-containing protein n=1 Tax=Natronoglycomyces albus TaxID=2811108 RepID=A0A895XRH0_9ACTN|nr:CHAT domain-containing protein [Natronoglycomyces albus]QSB05939.1 CHAT domain-containing protein [Natronoglycomyces albus]
MFQNVNARFETFLALAELAGAQREDPIPHLQEGLDFLAEHRSKYGSIEFQAGVSMVGQKLADFGLEVVADRGEAKAILAWTERVRAQNLQVPPTQNDTDPAVRDQMAQLRRARNDLWDAQLNSQPVDEVAQRVADLESKLRSSAWQQAGPGHVAEETTPDQIKALAAEGNATVISYFEYRGKLAAIVVSGEDIQWTTLTDLAEVEELARQVNADLDALASDFLPTPLRGSVTNSLQSNVARLADSVLTPLDEHVGTESVVIVPTRALNWVPWGMMPQLVDRPVTVAPSASVWWRCTRQNSPGGRVLLASGPALREVHEEFAAVARCYDDPDILTGEDATPEAILSAMDGAAVAHLAAHGQHEPDNVLFSRLNFHDGPLMAYDLDSLDTAPTEVILSACELGRSTVDVGDETLGFTAALLHAGTSTVIASLTRVPEQLSADMMSAYHRGRAAGLPPAKALAEAGKGHPWHPFICFGRG